MLVWPEAERDIDPTGNVRAAVRAGDMTPETVDNFVRRQVAENPELCCSNEQLREYVLALIQTLER